jgi:hypothetical protein
MFDLWIEELQDEEGGVDYCVDIVGVVVVVSEDA